MLTRRQSSALAAADESRPCATPQCEFYGTAATQFLCSRCAQFARNNEPRHSVDRSWLEAQQRQATQALRSANMRLATESEADALSRVPQLANEPDQCALLLQRCYQDLCHAAQAVFVLTVQQSCDIAAAAYDKWGARDNYRTLSDVLVLLTHTPWLLPVGPPYHAESLCYHGNMGDWPHTSERMRALTTQCRFAFDRALNGGAPQPTWVQAWLSNLSS